MLIAGLLLAGHVDGRGPQPHIALGGNVGFGVVDAGIPCAGASFINAAGEVEREDCSSAFAGIAFGGSLGLMWGRTHRLGLKLDGALINTKRGGRGALADALFIYHWHGPVVYVEGGLGLGYTVAQNLDGDRRGLNVAMHALAGLPISEHVAGTLRLAGAVGGMSAFVSTLGLEWSF